jgi:hypothetical protein
MRVCVPAFPNSAFVLYTEANKLLHLVCNLCSHSLLVVLNFMPLDPFVFVATPFWWCELFLSLSNSFLRRHSFLVWRNIRGLLAFLFRSHSFLVMRKVRASFRLVSWLLSFDRDISHERKMAQPIL